MLTGTSPFFGGGKDYVFYDFVADDQDDERGSQPKCAIARSPLRLDP